MYCEELMDHYKHPRGKGILKFFDFQGCDTNPSCGDKVCFSGTINSNVISQLSFDGVGCIISQALASMLVEHCVQKDISYVQKLSKHDVQKWVGIELGPNRIKCALLPLLVLQESLLSLKGST